MAPAQPQLTTFFRALPRKGGLAAGVAKVGGRGRPAPPHRSPVPSRTPSPAPADGDAAGSDASLPQSSPANDALAPPPRVRPPIAARTFAAPKRRRGDAGPAGEPDAAPCTSHTPGPSSGSTVGGSRDPPAARPATRFASTTRRLCALAERANNAGLHCRCAAALTAATADL